MCQCPQRASTYFFRCQNLLYSRRCYVSMPSTGFYLFLLDVIERCGPNIACQCPQRASTYFFGITKNIYGWRSRVSMPSTGFYLFLQFVKCLNVPRSFVSMPSTGFYLFLRRKINTTYKSRMCQCPQRASTYFFNIISV